MNRRTCWKAEDVVVALRGECLHEQSWTASGVSIDSGAVSVGDLFVALEKTGHDGHNDVSAAFAAGARAALVMRQPLHAPPGAPLVFVKDTTESLLELGRLARARTKGTVVSVTGAIGKTTTKDMLAAALGAVCDTFVASESLARPLDAALALANVPPDAGCAVFEMGAYGEGELRELALLVRPEIAVVTPLEPAHLRFFDPISSIVDRTAEVFQGVLSGGAVVMGRENEAFARLAALAKKSGIKNICSFSDQASADAFLKGCSMAEEASLVRAVVSGKVVNYMLNVPGEHQVRNSLAALLAAFMVTGRTEECAAALGHYRSSRGFGASEMIALSDGSEIRLIDESFDASPASVRAALRVFGYTIPMGAGRRILVLGDMDDLGAASPDWHLKLISDIRNANVELVFACGEASRYMYDALPAAMHGGYAFDVDELAPLLMNSLQADDVVVVKGAPSMRMEVLVDAVKALGADSRSRIVNE